MSGEIIYSPETMTYILSNGTDRIMLPNWAHRMIKDEVEREIRPLNNKIEILSDALALARDDNAKLRELVKRMWYVFIGIKRATFADRLRTRHEIDELGIEVD